MKINRYDLPIHPMEYGTPNMVFGNWCRAIDVAKLEESHAELLKALKELYYTVQGEVPSLLDEDSDGNGYLDVEIINAIAKAEGTR